MATAQSHTDNQPVVRWARIIASVSTLIAVMALLLFGAAGSIDWWQAWVYLAFYVISLCVSRLWLYLNNPDLARERLSALEREDVPLLEKALTICIAVIIPAMQMLAAGLDRRYHGSPEMPPAVLILAAGLLIASYSFAVWAMMINPYYSLVMRIQRDRGQVVISSGPYALLRHPSYSAVIAAFIAISLFLGSLWSLWLLIPYAALVIWRTIREDRMLLSELQGYREYAARVRYRLLPGIW